MHSYIIPHLLHAHTDKEFLPTPTIRNPDNHLPIHVFNGIWSDKQKIICCLRIITLSTQPTWQLSAYLWVNKFRDCRISQGQPCAPHWPRGQLDRDTSAATYDSLPHGYRYSCHLHTGMCTGTCLCMLKWSMFIVLGRYHSRCVCMFRLSTERTSLTNLSASSIGSRLRRAVSVGFENHDVIGNALSATAQDIKC